MGDAAPPMLDASAIPRRRALAMLLSDGKLRKIGCHYHCSGQLKYPRDEHFYSS
jgi:hypothetical protein